MNDYKVIGFDVKTTKNGDPYKSLKLKDRQGNMYNYVAYWSSLPDYETITVGSIIKGTITTSQNGQYENHKLTLAGSPQAQKGPPRGSKFNNADTLEVIEKSGEKDLMVQQKIQEGVASSQDRNEVMWAKYNASELVAHHPAYSQLTEVQMFNVIKDLTKAILMFNPRNNLSPLEVDDIQSVREVARAEQVETISEDEISPEDMPF